MYEGDAEDREGRQEMVSYLDRAVSDNGLLEVCLDWFAITNLVEAFAMNMRSDYNTGNHGRTARRA